MELKSVDHLVLTVADIERTCEFYERILGADIVTFAGNRRAVQIGEQKLNLHEIDNEFEPAAADPTPGSADFCLITEKPIESVVDDLIEHGVEPIEGPVDRTGARGPIRSVYIRDPDDNLVELAEYESE